MVKSVQIGPKTAVAWLAKFEGKLQKLEDVGDLMVIDVVYMYIFVCA